MARRYRVQHGEAEFAAETHGDGVVVVDGVRCTVVPLGSSRFRVTTPDGRATVVSVAGDAPAVWACADGQVYDLDVDASPRARSAARAGAAT